MWEAMGAPIRCLDELSVILRVVIIRKLMHSSDVFMDSVNREISMEMMVGLEIAINRVTAHSTSQIKFARGSRGKQFILITPQSMSKISPNDHDVKVNKYAYLGIGNTLVSVANGYLGCVILSGDKRSFPSLLHNTSSSLLVC